MSARFKLTRLLLVVFICFAGALRCSADDGAADDVPLKATRSEFDLRDFRDFINHDLSVPQPGGKMPTGDRTIRVIQGRVVDREGQPIAGAQIAFAEAVGRHNLDYDECYDLTDELGRFVVQGDGERTRIVVRRGAGQVWNVPIEAKQTFVLAMWPAPSRVRVAIAPELSAPGAKITLASKKYWAGMGPLRVEAVLGDDGTAKFENVLPGDFRVYTRQPLVRESVGSEYAEREFGQVTIAAGETRELTYDGTGRVPVRGEAPDGWCVVIERERTRYEDTFGYVDGVLVGDDGKFVAHVPGPGVYKLNVKARPVATVDGELVAGQRIFVNGVALRRRFVVDAMTKAVELAAEEDVDPTVAFVHNELDSEGPMNVSWSYTDVQAAQLCRHKDRAGVAAELLRILNDPHAPHDWTYVTLQAVGGMTDTPEVVEGLIKLLAAPREGVGAGSLIEALSTTERDVPRIVDIILPYCRHDQWTVRWKAHYCLGRMAIKHPEIKPQITPSILAALGDEHERIRSDAASQLGWMEIKPAAADLIPLLGDSSYKVRLAAARALWQTTGDSGAIVPMATEVLAQEGSDFEAKKDAAYALRDVVDLPPETRDALRLHADYPQGPPFNNHADVMRFQLASIAKEILKAQPGEQDERP